jgi:type IV secretion system protein VirD4
MRYLWATFTMLFYVLYGCTTFTAYAFVGSYRFVKAFRKWRDKDKPTHGDAHYEDDKSLKKRGYLTHNGFLAGITVKGKRVFTRPERTVIMLAPPGSGKSQHFIADLRAKMSRTTDKLPHLIIGDAADELWHNTAKILETRGYQLAKIDLVQPDGWTKYDVLSGLDTSFSKRYLFGRQVDAICRLLVTDEPTSKQPHFVEFARLLLKCAIIVNVRYEGNDKPISDIVAELISEEKRSGLLKRAKVYQDDLVNAALGTMEKMSDKPEGLSMMSTGLRKLEGWLDDAVKDVTTYHRDAHGKYLRGWRFEQMLSNPQPVALFLHTGTNETASGNMARLIYGNAINAVSTMLDTGEKMTRELEVLIDEAGLIGYCNAISHAYNRLRKAGVRIRMCFLGLDEFQQTYPDHKKIWAGSDIIAFGGSNEMELGRNISELIGDYTVHSRSESESDKGGSKGRAEQPRRRIKPDEIRRMEENEELMLLDNIVVRGLKPWARKPKGGIRYL